jgi:uncharacterized protein YdaU (DUF1376 family)
MHYYKFNIADYRKDTSHLSTLEHGVYRQLIDWQYLDEKPIPLETQVVFRRLRLGSIDEQQALENVLSEFFEKSDDGYFQKRIRVEILDYQENAEKNRRNGKLGGRPSKTHSVSSGLPNETQSKGNQEPITNNHKPIKERATVVATPIGVSEIVWQDFKNHRRAKKAQVTQRVVDEIAKQAMLAGWPLEEAMKETVVRNWQTFKAEWVTVKQNTLSKTGQMNQSVMSGLTRGLIGGGGNVKFIEG